MVSLLLFWLGNGLRSRTFWVVFLCDAFFFFFLHCTQIWEFSHSEICLWLENCHSRRKLLVCGRSWRGGPDVWSVSSPTPSTLVSQRYRGHWWEKLITAFQQILTVRVSLITAWPELARRVCFHCFRCELQSDATSLFLGGFGFGSVWFGFGLVTLIFKVPKYQEKQSWRGKVLFLT